MTLQVRKELELKLNPVEANIHLWSLLPVSTGSRQPDQSVEFCLDPTGHRVGNRVHCGGKLMLVGAVSVERRYKVDEERNKWSEW